jgi:two-component system cell cycle response regulator
MIGYRVQADIGSHPEAGVSAPRVLVADDSPLVLRLLEKMLSGAGLGVVTARDGLEAVEKAFVEDVSLVILDVMMPRMSGYQACRLLKTEPATRHVPVVILTSKDQAGDRFWGLETGADYYITKDADPQTIVKLVRDILDGEGGTRGSRAVEGQRDSVDILSRVNELLDRKLYELTILSELGAVSKSLVNFDETFTSVMGVVVRVVDFAVGAWAFLEDEDLQVVLMLRRPMAPTAVDEVKARLFADIARHRGGGAPFGRVQARLFAPTGAEAGAAEEASLGGFASFPVLRNQELTGLLAVGGRAAARIAGETQAFMGQVAHHAHIVLENSRLFDRIKNLSIRDSLTELFNHRHSLEVLGNELHRVGRYEGGIGVLMIDIDHFKAINDAHGHQAGDHVLREIARRLRNGLRAVDSLGRYGGEEFLIVLPHTTTEDARQTAERLRRAIVDEPFHAAGREITVTVSIGVAAYSSTADTPDALIREADAALYRAKQAGRNRVV